MRTYSIVYNNLRFDVMRSLFVTTYVGMSNCS